MDKMRMLAHQFAAAARYSSRIPKSLMSLPQRDISDFMVAVSYTGVPAITSMPALNKRSRTSARCNVCTIS